MGVAVLLLSAAYYYENADFSLAALTEKVKATLAPPPVKQQDNILKGRITHVRDGDTFEVRLSRVVEVTPDEIARETLISLTHHVVSRAR